MNNEFESEGDSMRPTTETTDDRIQRADALIEAITRKLRAHRDTIARSLGHGTLQWRSDKSKDNFEIDLHPKL